MKKRTLLAFSSLAVGVVASLTAPSAHAASAVGDGTTPNLAGNHTLLDPLLGSHQHQPTTSGMGDLVPLG
ncbi:hypothetical protein ACFYNO_36990 [Kitasatospora sp. NPDC006697]|uniref:hypothetical protein n=1 Tax=Kitasatospora sp. NPDC006697 TaxID=3364020 RepID=UPI0036A67FE6